MDVGEEYEDIEIGNAEKPKSQWLWLLITYYLFLKFDDTILTL
jgi:hypothetical protein